MQRRNTSELVVRHNVTKRTSTRTQKTTVRRIRPIHLRFRVIAVKDADTNLSVVSFSLKSWPATNVAGLNTKRQSAEADLHQRRANISTRVRILRGLLQRIGEQNLQIRTARRLEIGRLLIMWTRQTYRILMPLTPLITSTSQPRVL